MNDRLKHGYCLQEKKDCFAYTEFGECRCLDVTGYTDENPCPFFKTREQHEKEKKKYPPKW